MKHLLHSDFQDGMQIRATKSSVPSKKRCALSPWEWTVFEIPKPNSCMIRVAPECAASESPCPQLWRACKNQIGPLFHHSGAGNSLEPDSYDLTTDSARASGSSFCHGIFQVFVGDPRKSIRLISKTCKVSQVSKQCLTLRYRVKGNLAGLRAASFTQENKDGRGLGIKRPILTQPTHQSTSFY